MKMGGWPWIKQCTAELFAIFAFYLKNYSSYKKIVRTKFVGNVELYIFCDNYKYHLTQWIEIFTKNPLWMNDLRRTWDIRLLSQFLKPPKKDVYKYLTFYLSFRG